MPSPHGPSDTIVGEIWRLNSQKHRFVTQNRVCAEHTPFWGVLCARTGLGEKFEIMVVQPPYFAGRPVFCHTIGRHIKSWCQRTEKSMLSQFSGLWINATILALILETMKIGAASIFVYTNTNTWYVAIYTITILDLLQNMVRNFLELHSNHANMCAR